MKKFNKIILINFFIVLITFILIEVYLFIFKPNHLELDKNLGWKLKKNLNIKKEEKDFYGKKYSVNFNTNDHGIISFFNNSKKKYEKEILVIGDSFSNDPYVSIEKMWYSHLGKMIKNKFNTNLKINVIGAGGYGSLQQYELIKIHKKNKNINPEIIIFQFCSNDFENNLFELEKINGSLNQYLRRPYLDENNKIYYDNSILAKLMRIPFFGESRVLNKIIFLYSINKKKQPIDDKLLKKSFFITNKIIEKIIKMYPETQNYIFNCVPDNKTWMNLQVIKNFNVIKEVDIYLEKAKKNNKKIYFKDGGHYNELGHKIISQAIISNRKFLSNF